MLHGEIQLEVLCAESQKLQFEALAKLRGRL